MCGNFTIRIAVESDIRFVQTIVTEIDHAAQDPATGICRRSASLLIRKIEEGLAVIALSPSGEWAGFCYIQEWDEGRFVSSCALVTAPKYRSTGIAAAIKQKIFELARLRYPNATLFGLTTSAAVMKINTQLGYIPVPYSEITKDTGFWNSCQGCQHYDILERKKRTNCLCTAMLYPH
jgi:GNAT superfamily N-acetyltransferase